MRFSIKIARLFGIDIRVHALFLLPLALVVLDGAQDGLASLIEILILFGGLFLFVLLHELGHSLVAIRKGVRVLDITLWPLGGLARLAGMPTNPSTELAITIAGPAVNFVLAAALLPVLFAFRTLPRLLDVHLVGGGILETFFLMNLWMGLFNLIPAFPLDGGRVLRALLARRSGYLRATELAVRAGRLIALCGFVWGLWTGQLWTVFIAVFVWVSGMQELLAARWQDASRRAFDDVGFPSEPGHDFEPDSVRRDDGRIPAMTPERRAALDEALARLRRDRETRDDGDEPHEP
ncbi:MAG: site-2 protease family protein [Planctomycetes bacterium]|nr:site-2 protease family protein [Planctomycetota bacterium]MBI3846888.1 site-2 protease family protein [Planctomycetota bacterium]